LIYRSSGTSIRRPHVQWSALEPSTCRGLNILPEDAPSDYILSLDPDSYEIVELKAVRGEMEHRYWDDTEAIEDD